MPACRWRRARAYAADVRIVVPVHDIARGDTITESDLTYATVHGASPDVGRCLPRSTKSRAWRRAACCAAGKPFRGDDVRRPIVVTKGETVTMQFDAPGVELTAMGRAMGEGGVGDTVTVQNPASYRMITAIVTAPGTVRATGILLQPQPTASPVDRIQLMRNVFAQNFRHARGGRFAVRLLGGGPHQEYRRGPEAGRRWAIPPAPRSWLTFPRPSPSPMSTIHCGSPARRAFFTIPAPCHIGDVITVNVTVADAAKLQDTTSRSRTNSDDANLTNFFGLGERAAQRHESRQPGQDGIRHIPMSAPAAIKRDGDHQHDVGRLGGPGPAQRQSGDRWPSAGAGEQRDARHAACRASCAAKTSPSTIP